VAIECVVFIGLPASGKSTFYVRRFAATHKHISKDLMPASARKGMRQTQELRAALAAGVPVVVDNTNATAADRTEIITVAREFGARVIGYFFAATPREAVGRNRGREGKARVPDVAIFATAKRMTTPVHDEGFDELYQVAIRDDGGFDVALM